MGKYMIFQYQERGTLIILLFKKIKIICFSEGNVSKLTKPNSWLVMRMITWYRRAYSEFVVPDSTDYLIQMSLQWVRRTRTHILPDTDGTTVSSLYRIPQITWYKWAYSEFVVPELTYYLIQMGLQWVRHTGFHRLPDTNGPTVSLPYPFPQITWYRWAYSEFVVPASTNSP